MKFRVFLANYFIVLFMQCFSVGDVVNNAQQAKISKLCCVMYLKKFKKRFWGSTVLLRGKTINSLLGKQISNVGQTLFDRLARALAFCLLSWKKVC